MLKMEEFVKGLKELGTVHSGVLISARVNRYFEAVKHLTPHQYSRLVNHFLDNAKFAPTPEEFRSAAQTITYNDQSYVQQKNTEDVDPRSPEKLNTMLEKYGVRSLLEAVELEAQKRRQKG